MFLPRSDISNTIVMNSTSILIVDDEMNNRDILARRLLREGYTVAQAESGQQALSMMGVERYDLVLLDIMMPQMDGYAVLDIIKGEVRWRDTPVIMLSALDDTLAIERCLNRGAYDYLTKPYQLSVLKTRMWRCFRDHGVTRLAHEHEQTPRTVLIVDDEPLNRDLLLRRVEKLGHTAWAVASGAEALHTLERRTIDLILLDIMIPQMDGFAVLDALRERPTLQDTVVIMVSALGDSTSLSRCVQLGASDFIVKPYNAVLLKEKIANGLALRDSRLQQREARQRLERLEMEGKLLRNKD